MFYKTSLDSSFAEVDILNPKILVDFVDSFFKMPNLPLEELTKKKRTFFGLQKANFSDVLGFGQIEYGIGQLLYSVLGYRPDPAIIIAWIRGKK